MTWITPTRPLVIQQLSWSWYRGYMVEWYFLDDPLVRFSAVGYYSLRTVLREMATQSYDPTIGVEEPAS